MARNTRMRTALVAALALVITGLGVGAASADDSSLEPGVNLLTNGNFSNGSAGWGPYEHEHSTDSEQYCGTVTGPVDEIWDAGFNQAVELSAGEYVLSFDASTTGTFAVVVQQGGEPYDYFGGGEISGAEETSYEFPVTVDEHEPNGSVAFHVGGLEAGESSDFCIDNIFLGAPAKEYVDGYTWDDWLVIGSQEYATLDGAF